MTFAFASTFGEVVARAWASALRVAAPIRPSLWARNLIVPDGPRKLDKWDPSLTPHIIEPLDFLSLSDPGNEAYVMKSAQTGFTTLLLASVGHSIDREPSDMLLVQPTDGALTDFNGLKLGPMIENTAALAAKVKPQTSRSGQGSTTYSKKFGSYTLTLAISTSTSDLRSKTIQKVLLDEVDEYPLDVNGQGDPVDMAIARQESFLESGEWKRIQISTPTLKGASRIEAGFNKGDKRLWHMPCPGCGREFVFEFGKQFRYNRAYPFNAYYVTPCCGHRIEGHQKKAVYRKGRWVATAPGPGKPRSYYLGGMTSPFVPWDIIAQRFIEAGDDPAKLKTFFNLTLGLPFEEELSEVSAKEIVAATEDFPRGTVPIRAALTVLSVDFNGEWAEWALYAYGPSATGDGVDQWLVEHGTIDGKPGDAQLAAALTDLVERRWPYAGGGAFPADRVGLDTGFGTNEVYRFVKGKPRLLALDGRPYKLSDPMRALPLGTPRKVAVKDQYGRVRFKVWLHPVGSHDQKVWLASALARLTEGNKGPNAIHLPREIVGAEMADQFIAEVLLMRPRRDGRAEQAWVPRRGVRNEALDLAVYARAVAMGAGPNGLDAGRVRRDQWADFIVQRHGLDPAQSDLFSASVEVAAARPAREQESTETTDADPDVSMPPPAPVERLPQPKPVPPPRRAGGWLGETKGWLRSHSF